MIKKAILILFSLLMTYSSASSLTLNAKLKAFDSNNWYIIGKDSRIFFMKTTNGGINWVKYSNIFGDETYSVYSMSFPNKITGYACGYRTGTTNGWIAKTTNGGATWDTIYQPTGYGKMAISFYNSNTGYTADAWYPPNFINRGIWKTTNGGNNWFKTYSLLNTTPYCLVAYDSMMVHSGNNTGDYLYSTNGGEYWFASGLIGVINGAVDDMYFLDGATGISCSTDDVSWGYTNNGGRDWGVYDLSGFASSDVKSIRAYGDNIYIIGDNETFLKSTNLGYNWSKLNYNVGNNAPGMNIEIVRDTLIVQRSNGTILKSNNAGVNWQAITPVPQQLSSISGIVRYSDNGNLVTYGTVKAFKYDRVTGAIIVYDSAEVQTNGTYLMTRVPIDSVYIGVYPNSNPIRDYVVTYYPSATYWEQTIVLYVTGNLTNINIYAHRMVDNFALNSVGGKVMKLSNLIAGNLKDAVIYATSGSTYVGFAISDDNGVYRIQSLPAGNLKFRVNRFGYRGDSTTVAVTSTSNIDSVNFYLNRLIIGIKQIDARVPSVCALYQNYPNPFNPVTRIKFEIPKSSQLQGYGSGLLTTLKVFDITGKEIVTLVNENLTPGTYEVTFNGSLLGSGVYFYKITAGDNVSVRKMLMIK